MQNTSDNEEYYNQPTASDWAEMAEYFRKHGANDYNDEELEAMCHYYEQQKQSILKHEYQPYYNPFKGQTIELPKLKRIK